MSVVSESEVREETTYVVPCIWTMYGRHVIDAASRDEAYDKAIQKPLPSDGEYLPDSLVVDYEDIRPLVVE